VSDKKNKYKTKAHLYHYSPGRLVIFIIADRDDRLGLDELALLARLVADCGGLVRIIIFSPTGTVPVEE
jgi:hypothetical protein